MQQSKIDSVVNQMIDGIRAKSRGFVLDLAAAGNSEVLEKLELLIASENAIPDAEAKAEIGALISRLRGEQPSTTIALRESLPPIDEWQRPADVRQHAIHDTSSLIDFAKRYGDKNKSLIMFDDSQATLTLDELVERGDRETVVLTFLKSCEWKTWSGLLGKPIKHRDLFAVIVTLIHTMADPSLLDACRKLKISAQVDHESNLQDDGKTQGFVVKTSAGEDLMKFPKEIKLHLPVLDQDVPLTDEWRTVTLRLLIELPDEPKEPVLFTLLSSDWNNVARERISVEGERIRASLPEFAVIHGTHTTRTRVIGSARR